MTLCILVMCRAHASLRGKASHELPMKTSCSSLCLEFSHFLSHTTLTKKSHIKYRVHKIEQNYKIVVNHNFTISPFGYFVTKHPKTNSRFKCEFGKNGKTHSHLNLEAMMNLEHIYL